MTMIASDADVQRPLSGALHDPFTERFGMKPRRVVIFTETFLPRVDGIVNTLRWTLAGLIQAGWETLVVAPHGNTGTLPGVRVIGANSAPCPIYPELRLGIIGPGVCQQLDAFKPDVVHLVGPAVIGLGGLAYAQSRRLPVLASYHTDLPRYAHYYSLGWLEGGVWAALRAIHNRCARTLCPSSVVKEQLEKVGFERLHHWARGVDSTQFSPEFRSRAWRERLGVHDDRTTLLLFVGRLAREKRVGELKALIQAVPDVALAIVGDGPARSELERTFRGCRVTFTGYLQGNDLAAAYASSDVFIFPSDTEAFGNVVLEAMACGLPVVSAAAGGVMDIVRPGQTGFLFEVGNPVSLTRQLSRYLASPDLRREHSQAARALAEQQTWRRQLDLLMMHYESTISGAQVLAA